ncbi:epimerase [Thermosipho sp. 1063]|uniref:PhzF family phenazine biosynthesis protein n=1 Tax=unclassified Thermosipho (in: thermotogales) TaxID=2676525 RepID=UPI0009494B8E|nr:MULTISPECIES: PhzF family phenazine biosynthesis protein [unclassified Thermosipho (in: thermotogales)]ANQ53729.1 epimerase [Thermosipho sp. 1070]APT72175.1 epimerase [Thermosipho sp. 1063]
MNFFIVDAFTNEPFKGNPAGVVLLDKEIPKKLKQNIAKEIGFSETSFVLKKGKEFFIEYFTPVSEIDICGHATIATFYVLHHLKLLESKKVLLHTKAGKLNIYISEEKIFMEQAQPKLGETIEKEKISKVLNISVDDFDTLPVQKAFTGLWDLIVPVKSKKILLNINPDLEYMKRFNDVASFHVFTLDESNGLCNTRNFAPLYGINEEAATGTANGALFYYLYKHNIVKKDKVYKIIQGESLNRKSEIFVTFDGKIKVGGTAKIIFKGQLLDF